MEQLFQEKEQKEEAVKINILLKSPSDPENIFRKYLWLMPQKDHSIMVGFHAEQNFLIEHCGTGVFPIGKEAVLANSEKFPLRFRVNKVSFHIKTGEVVVAFKGVKGDNIRLGSFTGRRDRYLSLAEMPNLVELCQFVPRSPVSYLAVSKEEIDLEMAKKGYNGFSYPAIKADFPIRISLLLLKKRINFVMVDPLLQYAQLVPLLASPNIEFDLGLLATPFLTREWPRTELFGYSRLLTTIT
jgi:hypothetical protein